MPNLFPNCSLLLKMLRRPFRRLLLRGQTLDLMTYVLGFADGMRSTSRDHDHLLLLQAIVYSVASHADNPKLLVHGQNIGCGLGLVSHSLSQQHLQIERSPCEFPYLGKTPTRHGHLEGHVEKVWQSECYCSLSIMDLGVSREKARTFQQVLHPAGASWAPSRSNDNYILPAKT